MIRLAASRACARTLLFVLVAALLLVAAGSSCALAPITVPDASERASGSTAAPAATPGVELRYDPDAFALDRREIERWSDRSTGIVRDYFGAFPVAHASVVLDPAPGGGVQNGSTHPVDGGTIRVTLGRAATARDLDADWVLVHEMVHLAIPSLAPEHHWFEEGCATYVEPIARARAGELSAERVWSEMIDGMPRGLSRGTKRGLDERTSWGATYWGGALFFLLADVQIRERTDNARSLRDALIAIVRAGGNIATPWPMEHVVAVADAATGVPVFAELYRSMALSASPVRLDELWKELGLFLDDGRVKMDDSAPLAHVRKAITAKSSGASAP